MKNSITRRQFARGTAAISLSALLPQGVFSSPAATQKVVVHSDVEIGLIRPEFHGQFAEHLGSCVYGGLWVGKDSPISNVDGYRKAAIDYLAELGIPVLRWPGGCFADDYHWRDGIGPLNKRPKRVNIHWGDYVEDNSFGVHEFIGLCRKIGAEPYLAGNVGSGTPEELRDWVEYCNYPSGSTLSDERAANGSPEPFRVRYWGVGNENWGCGGNMTPERYADLFRQFAGYLRPFGGTRPFLIACGPNGNDMRWSRGFLTETTGSRQPDGFAMHFYETGLKAPTLFDAETANTQFSIFPRVEQAIIQQRGLLDTFEPPPRGGRGGAPPPDAQPRRTTNLLLDEWGVWDAIPQADQQKYGRLWQQITTRSAVAAGLGLNLFNRQADKLYMTNIAQMVNVLQSMLLTDGAQGKNCVRTTTYYAFMLFKPHRSKISVRVDTEGKGPLDLSVSASKGSGEMIVTFVNPRIGGDTTVDCAIAGARSATAQILHHSDMNAFNSFDAPDTVVTKSHPVTVEAGRLKLDVPALGIVTARVML